MFSLPVSLFLCLKLCSHVGVGGAEVMSDIRYSPGEQHSPGRLNDHRAPTLECVYVCILISGNSSVGLTVNMEDVLLVSGPFL